MSGSQATGTPSPPHKRASWWGPISLGVGLGVGLIGSMLLSVAFRPAPPIPDSILSEPHLIERTAAFASALAEAKPESLARLRGLVDSFEPGPQEADLILFAEWWADFDPEAANAWAKAFEKTSDLQVRWGVFRAWARNDPRAALAFANASFTVSNPTQTSSSGSWQNPGVQAVLVGWDESGDPGLESWIFEIPDRQERQGLMEFLARRRVITMEPEAAWSWADELPPGLRQDMLPRVASALAARDPAEAVRLATPVIERDESPGVPRRIATRWAKRDPQAALEWLSEILAGPERKDAVVEAARTWITQDRKGFQAYMEQNVEAFPEWLEPAFGLYARTLARDGDSEAGLAIAERIRSVGQRDYNVTLILRHWLEEDPAAAAAWIEAHDVPEPIRRRAGFENPRS